MSVRKGAFVNLVYLDDSCDDVGFQLIGAVIVPEDMFPMIEKALAWMNEHLVPSDLQQKFEFHASAMFHGKAPFEKLGRDKALEILGNCVALIEHLAKKHTPISVVYGAVDTRKLRAGKYATAQPIDIAFRSCLDGLVQWFDEKAVVARLNIKDLGTLGELGILICDNTQNQHVKDNLQKSFRAYRRKLKSSEHDPGKLAFVHDDMYFGDSAYSVGIQFADICSYIILRHLQGKEDTEYLYQRLSPHIYWGSMEPDGKKHGKGAEVAVP